MTNMNIYYNDNNPVEKEPMETAKDVLMDTGKIIDETYSVLIQLSDNLIGKEVDPIGIIQSPEVPEASMMDVLIKQRDRMECILKLVIRLKERMY